MICPDCANPLEALPNPCRHCGWIIDYVNGIPFIMSSQDKRDSDFKEYQSNYDQICQDDLTHSIQDKSYLKLQSENLKSYIGNVANLTVCEVGVGQGELFNYLKQDKPKELIGIDISVGYLTRMKKDFTADDHNLSLIIANAENIPYQNKFDVVVASDILEHVFNVGNFLYSANRSLKMGGKLIVRVPYNENIMGYSRFLGCPYKFVHLRSFAKKNLVSLLKYAGFEVDNVIYDGFHPAYQRNYVKKHDFINKRFKKYIQSKFESEFHVTGINRILGQLLMRPLELNAVCTKIVEHEQINTLWG